MFPGSRSCNVEGLNVHDILRYEHLVFLRSSLEKVERNLKSMKEAHQIIKRPLITEKSTRQKEAGNQIAFVVDPRANKVQIRQAVEKLFKVKVQRSGP